MPGYFVVAMSAHNLTQKGPKTGRKRPSTVPSSTQVVHVKGRGYAGVHHKNALLYWVLGHDSYKMPIYAPSTKLAPTRRVGSKKVAFVYATKEAFSFFFKPKVAGKMTLALPVLAERLQDQLKNG
eukprot:6024445-Amphidinium_carterae.1